MWLPSNLSFLAKAYADAGQLGDAWRCIGEAVKAVETTKEKWFEAEIHRMAGEIALMQTSERTATVKAVEDTTVLSIARKDFTALVQNLPLLEQAMSQKSRSALALAGPEES